MLSVHTTFLSDVIPKAKTLIEKHGFSDVDRKNPSHDEIQIWVLSHFKRVVSTALCIDFPDEDFRLEMEYPVVDRSFVVGFIDIYCNTFRVAIEIKSSISSIGDLVRQIQFYRKYVIAHTWIVVSPDSRFKGVLESQGVKFFQYREPIMQGPNQLSLPFDSLRATTQ